MDTPPIVNFYSNIPLVTVNLINFIDQHGYS